MQDAGSDQIITLTRDYDSTIISDISSSVNMLGELLSHNPSRSTVDRASPMFSVGDDGTLKVPGSNPGVDDQLSSGPRGTEERLEPLSVWY